jgi:hypothetical protein
VLEEKGVEPVGVEKWNDGEPNREGNGGDKEIRLKAR